MRSIQPEEKESIRQLFVTVTHNITVFHPIISLNTSVPMIGHLDCCQNVCITCLTGAAYRHFPWSQIFPRCIWADLDLITNAEHFVWIWLWTILSRSDSSDVWLWTYPISLSQSWTLPTLSPHCSTIYNIMYRYAVLSYLGTSWGLREIFFNVFLIHLKPTCVSVTRPSV